MATICFAVLESTQSEAAVSHSGSYTTDDVTGFQWLDLSETLNQSYDVVSGELGVGGQFAGHRYATEAEVIALADSAGFLPGGVPGMNIAGTDVVDYLSHLVSSLGSVAVPEGHSSIGYISLFQDAEVRYVDLYDSEVHQDGARDHVNSLSTLHAVHTSSDPNIGSFLIRTIPEPTTLTLAAFSLLGIGYRRRSLKPSKSLGNP
jgi:hypothetical protein